ADTFTVLSTANQVEVESITFTNVSKVQAGAETNDPDKGDSVNATDIDVYLTGNDKELSSNGILFQQIESGNVTDTHLFGSATASDSVLVLDINE
uniref:hypothetical protein n=1 Tax=uncultured Microbulbifer sp. TaxID=348147 RepID=UPI0026262F6D